MPFYVVGAGVTQIQLPDGLMHKAGDTVEMTPEQYGTMDAGARALVTLVGDQPSEDIEFTGTVQNDVGAAGTAAALPTPAGYVSLVLAGTTYLIALFNAVAALIAPVLNAVTTAATGGTLAAATYFYKVTATDVQGETTGSNEQSVTTVGATSTTTVPWAVVTGASGYKIYRGTAAGAENALVTTITNGATVTFTDIGAATTPATVPVANTTAQGAAAVDTPPNAPVPYVGP